MTPDREDPGGVAGRLELQARLLDLLRNDLEAARQANEAKDRANLETWRRLRLHEMLLEESQRERARAQEERARLQQEREQERARLNDELAQLRSTLSWRLTAPLRRLPRLGQAAVASRAAGPAEDGKGTPPEDTKAAARPSEPRSPTARVQPKRWRQLDLMEDALRHLHEKGFRPRVVLDVGAATGTWSTAAARVFPEAAFYLFDPLEENELALRVLCERDPRFHYSLMALGRERTTLHINVGPDLAATSVLTFPGTHHEAVRRPVPAETVDGLMADGRLPGPDLVKLDVQGFELEVLAGGTALFGTGCVFIVEVSLFEFLPRCPVVEEVVAYFGQRGYRLFDVAGLLRRPFEDDLGQMDMVFVSRDSPLVASSRWS